MSKRFVVYCCENSAVLAAETVDDTSVLDNCDIVSLPCSGRVESALILKTLERGYGGVVVLGCPEDNCKFVTGNKRAASRVQQVREILDSAGMDGDCVRMQYVSSVDAHKVEEVMRGMVEKLQPVTEAAAEGAASDNG